MTEQRTAEASQSQAGRPPTVTVGAMQPLPTSGENQKRPREGGTGSEPLLDWPAYGRLAGPTCHLLELPLGMEVKLNRPTGLQPTPPSEPTSKHYK